MTRFISIMIAGLEFVLLLLACRGTDGPMLPKKHFPDMKAMMEAKGSERFYKPF